METSTKPQHQGKTGNSSHSRVGKGIDLSLPPLHSIDAIFADIATRAIQLGLCKALENLGGHPINIATMCSGTESPLLALDLLSKALHQVGLPPIHIKHHFSAEIEVIKHGYIERNFQPDILFRDIRDFIPEGATTATTAYGADVPIPYGLDILVAGFVCKDLSRMNNNGKDLDDDGESGDTWRAVYKYVERFRPSIVLLENVKAKRTTWDDVTSRWRHIGYEAAWLYCDTKNYYLPQTRERMYMIAIDQRRFGKDSTKAVNEWKDLMKSLRRQCSSPYEAFLSGLMQESNEYSALASESDWALCKLRYDHIRSEERLGILRPSTKWSENGTIRPPDFANRKWYHSQSSRVYDAIDVAHLQAAQKGYDSQHKMAVWDVSQNVDRFKADLGIVPCISPDGCDFASNHHRALNGKQLLVLQGMPLDKLLFARETQKDCQDLAGNAMSTTVIGTSLISAIICGWKSFRSHNSSTPFLTTSTADRRVPPTISMVKSSTQHMLCCVESAQLDVHGLKHHAVLSARLCNCEGETGTTQASVQRCSVCNHTACEDCAGNPKHAYSILHAKGGRPQTPIEFISKWRHKLPARVRIENFPDMQKFAAWRKDTDQVTSTFMARVVKANIGAQYFYFSDLSRQDRAWRATYTSPQARLELRIGHDVDWMLFVTCVPNVPANSSLRKLLEAPFAQARVVESLLNAQWQLFMPSLEGCKLHMSGSAERSKSWRSRLGLVDYSAETVPNTISIRSLHAKAPALEGKYDFSPHCGTACGSMYKRATNPALYLFLESDPIGQSDSDSFIFSFDCSRKRFGDARISLARLDSSWRPWHLEDQFPSEVSATLPGSWVPVDCQLRYACPVVKANVLSQNQRVVRWQARSKDCSQLTHVLTVQVHESVPVHRFSNYSWMLEQAKFLPSFPEWQQFDSNYAGQCHCSPVYPRILWNVNEKGMATPHEDGKAAALFERAIKTRPPIFQIQTATGPQNTQIQVGVNIDSLVHRARRRLAQFGTVSTAWRLATDHTELRTETFPRFRLHSNSKDTQCTLSSTLRYLRGAQPRSLSWMASQEQGRSITVTEVEEAVQSDLGWRAEARAQAVLTVRGGVLADLPSFGKTVTTIALVQSEFEQSSPDALLHHNKALCEKLPALIDSAATLIVCPPHIALQWQAELKKFLGTETFSLYGTILIENYAQLRRLTLEKMRDSRIIILSWTVFAEEGYISQLAQFTALPEPATTNRRAFDVWFSRVAEEIPGQISALQSASFDQFKESTLNLLKERLQHEDFQAALPIEIQHGSAYQSYNSLQIASRNYKGSRGRQPQLRQNAQNFRGETHPVPLLHFFRFNRIVIDEYHYLDDHRKTGNMLASVSVKMVAAHKRWLLSGTPSLSNFTDVDRIASYLGIKLGRYFHGDGTVTTQLEKTRKGDQTLVERFLSQTDVMSRQWHLARDERAQEFLDLFVRQNEAELQHITCSEALVSVELSVDHKAIYLELSQHLISQRMQIRKLSKSSSDRADRLNASLGNSTTAEEALLRSALLFETLNGQPGLESLIEKRSDQCGNTEKELCKHMAGLESLKMDKELTELYGRFKKDIKSSNWLGDQEATQIVRRLLLKAEKSPSPKDFPKLKSSSDTKAKQHTKIVLSQLRELCRELALRKRSERFVRSIRDFVQKPQYGVTDQAFTCSSPECNGKANLAQIVRTDDESCVRPSCTFPVQMMNLIKASELDSAGDNNAGGEFGRKLEAITDLIQMLPKHEQAIIFAPNEDIISILEVVFDRSAISYHSPSLCRSVVAAEMIEDFKSNKDDKKRKKVLILNLGGESAAGVNLVNANHIIFVSPLLAKTQDDYDSAMVQAIARSRRYGQVKQVHIYHVVAQRTIDVDILEHRHKRADGVSAVLSTMKMPKASGNKKEKTRYIKNNAGEMALVPSSWLTDETKRQTLNIGEKPHSFTSLINFSETFENNGY
ncbi:hypothetical protein BKA66DRAFT_580830 [Pyrenochaeta sp. MPI-SDFR-AT-0127]|nr:hypothetical protein BKA66DRAFT_580830 [Pyrenochaeta sp. MPI-SDFR-AT-0127]